MIDSSPPSAESSFRELDEVFLQTQTRVWLGELLHIRLEEDLPLSDLLQDGGLLFEVSKVVWDLLLTKCIELRHLKHKYGPFGSKKSSGRYRPYSNVDSFLKICKILGLSGIDLFSPSDVVEKRDIRKVCICIRALSKKARSKLLNVPDFDMVIYSVTMPTDMVGVIRRSLESSQCTFSSSSSYSSRKDSQMKLKQKDLFAPSDRDDDSSSSEESDEAESRYMGENSFSPASKFDYADEVNSNLENSSETYPVSGRYRRQNVVESDVKCQCIEDFEHGQIESAPISEAVQSFAPHKFDKTTSCCGVSKKKLYDGISHANSEGRHNSRNGDVAVSNIKFALENDDSFMGDSSCIDVCESDYISNYLAFSDLMVHATDGSNSVVLDGENYMFDFFLNVDSQRVTTDKSTFHNGSQRIYSDDEDMEVSSTNSMSSVLGRLLNLEFDNQFDEDDSSSTNVRSSVSKEHKSEKLYKDSLILSEPSKEDAFDTQTHAVPFDSQEAQSKMTPRLLSSTECSDPSQDNCEASTMESQKVKSCLIQTSNLKNHLSLENKDVVIAHGNQEAPLVHEDKDKETVGTTMLGSDSIQGFNSQNASPVVSDDNNIHSSVRTDPCETILDNHPSFPVKDMNVSQEYTHVAYSIQHNISSAAEYSSQDKREHHQGSLAETISDGRKDATPQPPHGKHNRRPLLKTVVKGTAIAGVLFLLLHISSKSRGNNAQETAKNAQVLKHNGLNFSATKQQTRRVGKGIYPAEKIRLGN